MERSKQLVIGKMITALIKKELGKKFTPNYEGSSKGKIATLVIVGSSLKYINEVKSYLWKTFRITQEKINGHGGIATTIIIKLSELTIESLDKIETEFKIKFPEGISKRSTTPVIVKKESSETPAEEKVIAFDKQKSAPVESTKNGRMSVSKFLNSLFEFEEYLKNPEVEPTNKNVKNYFHYDKKLVDGYTVMHCIDVETATLIEGALTWYLHHKRWVSRLSDTDTDVSFIITNDNKREKMAGFLYCPPPSCNSSRDEINKRIRRVCHTGRPLLDSGETLTYGYITVTYSKKQTASKILELITEMGWNAEKFDDYTLTVFTNKSVKENSQGNHSEIKEEIIETKAEEQVEETPVAELESPIKAESQPVVGLENAFIPDFVHTFTSKDEAIKELNQVYSNRKLFLSFSWDTQKQIMSTLEKIWITEHAEEYTLSLLKFLNS